MSSAASLSRYATIVADPPWDHSDGTGVHWGWDYSKLDPVKTGIPYSTMSVQEIMSLPVGEWAARDAHLYLWTTNRFVRQVWEVAEAWGFAPVCILTWCKPRRGFLGGGAFKSDTEFCLFARRGNLPTLSRAPGRWYTWPRTRGAPVKSGERRDAANGSHSAKPEAFLDLVESVSPGPYLELFSRRARLGWDTWGDEALHGTEAVA